MQPCVGSKIVKAKPMTTAEFMEFMQKDGDFQNQDGYLVEYPDGYQGWNVKEEFERCSRILTGDEEVMLNVSRKGMDKNWNFYLTTKILGLFEIGNDGNESGEYYKVYYPNGHQSRTPRIKADEVYRKINKQELTLIKNEAKSDFDPWFYIEDGNLPEIYENENGLYRSDYVWVKCADAEYDEASLRKDSNQNMFWDFLDGHEFDGEITDIADDINKVKCWMYPIEPKR